MLRLADGCAPTAAFFSLQGCAELVSGLGIAVVTMGIGSSSSAAAGEQAYAVHRASITSCTAEHILNDGAETWAGDSGGALLFEDGVVVGMHLEVFDARPELSGGGGAAAAAPLTTSAGDKRRRRCGGSPPMCLRG